MFGVRLSEEQFAAIHDVAEQQHLSMSTMARAWFLDRLTKERRPSCLESPDHAETPVCNNWCPRGTRYIRTRL